MSKVDTTDDDKRLVGVPVAEIRAAAEANPSVTCEMIDMAAAAQAQEGSGS